MRALVLSDIHGNVDALKKVLAVAPPRDFDTVFLLGDLVGYGAGPNEVLDIVRGLEGHVVMVRGNHDKAVAGVEDPERFNEVALAAVRWTAEELEPEAMEFLRELPKGPVAAADGVVICHGSPLDEDEYLLSEGAALTSLEHAPAPLTFFGHTHLLCHFSLQGDTMKSGLLRGERGVLEIADGLHLLNPGSVGQPRDQDRRAGFMILDTDSRQVEWRRVEYPVRRAQRKIRRAGLPEVLATRLGIGY